MTTRNQVLMGFAIWEGVSHQQTAFPLMGKRFGRSHMQVLWYFVRTVACRSLSHRVSLAEPQNL